MTVSEKENVNILSIPNLTNKGNLLVYEVRYKEYIWVVDTGNYSTDGYRRIVINKSGDVYEPIEVFPRSLYAYPATEKVNQTSSKLMKYDEGFIFETYNLDN